MESFPKPGKLKDSELVYSHYYHIEVYRVSYSAAMSRDQGNYAGGQNRMKPWNEPMKPT